MKRHISWIISFTLAVTILMSHPLFAENLVNVNTASIEELATLRGVGEVRADAIMKYRQANGPFQSLDELKNVAGIGDKIIEANRTSIVLQPGTTATEKSRTKSDDVMANTKH
jgi:competence protein ComEA